MITPLLTSAISLLASLHGDRDDRHGKHRLRDGVFWLPAATGIIGTGFHFYNITKKPGGFSWQNLFYSAPVNQRRNGTPRKIASSL